RVPGVRLGWSGVGDRDRCRTRGRVPPAAPPADRRARSDRPPGGPHVKIRIALAALALLAGVACGGADDDQAPEPAPAYLGQLRDRFGPSIPATPQGDR